MSLLDAIGELTIETQIGKITGEIVQIGDQKVARFLGIPYAQQPVGDLRFEPLQALEGVLNDENGGPFKANKRGNSPFQTQRSIFATKLPMSEECIYLNIFTVINEEIQSDPAKMWLQKLPVFFHIHGGSFVMGSGSETYYDLSYFAVTHNAIGVSINYRLNYFGFISIPGWIEENLGLLDQQFALKWTNENIEGFGGDPKNVTLFGCSAGGASVHYHMLSKESSKYFKRAISISGVMTRAWSLCPRAKQKKKIDQLLEKLGCPKNTTPEDVKKFLKKVDAEEIIKFFPNGLSLTGLQFKPVDVFESENKSRDFISKKPLLLGICAEEGNLFPDLLFPRCDTSSQTSSRQTIANAMSEKIFFEPLRKLLSELVEMPQNPTYVYLFDYNCQSRSEVYPEEFMRSYYGKFHSVDVQFVLGFMRPDIKALKPNETDLEVAKSMNKMIGSFIKCSDSCDEDLPIQRHVKNNECVNRITETGISVEFNDCLMQVKNVSLLKVAGCAMLLKAFPNKF